MFYYNCKEACMQSRIYCTITINGMTLKNRAVMPPMGTGMESDSTISDRLGRILPDGSGGTGLIITEYAR